MNRGSAILSCLFMVSPSCFNEAPIHESGKYLGTWPPHGGARRFNEAPIHESGKSALADVMRFGLGWLQ